MTQDPVESYQQVLKFCHCIHFGLELKFLLQFDVSRHLVGAARNLGQLEFRNITQ